MMEIQTGVDRLLLLVNEKKEISVHDASKSLGINQSLLEEWCEILDEKGMIKIKYLLTGKSLVSKDHFKLNS